MKRRSERGKASLHSIGIAVWFLLLHGIAAGQPSPSSQSKGIISLRGGMKLQQKIGMIQQYIEQNHYGPKTIPVSCRHDGGLSGKQRAWEVADFKNQSVPHFRINIKGQPPKITGADWLNNENSSYFSGGYLLSQVYRYEATREKAALDECARALKGIKAIADLAGPDRFGWICKPFGGKLQDFSSPDQNIYIVQGLWSFLPYANKEQAGWIRRVIPAIAAYWERIHYTILSGADVWDMQKDPQFMRMFKVINLAAYDISKEKKYLDVADRLEAEHGELSARSVSLFDTRSASNPVFFADWRRISEFSINVFAPVQLNILQQLRPQKKAEYMLVWQRLLEQSLIGYDKEFGGHYYYTEIRQIDSQYMWRPMKTEWPTFSHEDLVNSDKFAYWRYPHRLYWFDATSRIPMVYLMYLKNGGKPIPYIEQVVYDIMEKLDFNRLHWMVDPHHDQTIPEIEFVCHVMTSETPNYISAWYLGQQLGFWKKM